jgi:hypothetical protein
VDVAELGCIQGAQVERVGLAIEHGLQALCHQAVRSVIASSSNILEISSVNNHDLVEFVRLSAVAGAGGVNLD